MTDNLIMEYDSSHVVSLNGDILCSSGNNTSRNSPTNNKLPSSDSESSKPTKLQHVTSACTESEAYSFIQYHIQKETDPFEILKKVVGPEKTKELKDDFFDTDSSSDEPDDSKLPETDKSVDYIPVWKFLFKVLTQPKRRKKLSSVTNIEHVVKLLKSCKKIIIITGAGISVSCGIPDFRSKSGLYASLKQDYPNLPDPSAMFDISFFKKDPRPFFDFAVKLWPGNFQPSLTHKFISTLDQNNQLLRNYTQNIDTLEQVAGIKNVIQCHGSFAKATCRKCKKSYTSNEIKPEIIKKDIPYCPCSTDKFEPCEEFKYDKFYESVIHLDTRLRKRKDTIFPAFDKIFRMNVHKSLFNLPLQDYLSVYDSVCDENSSRERGYLYYRSDLVKRWFESQSMENDNLPIIKPDIVFFGESLPESFHKQILEDRQSPDLILVIGSSMKVQPVASIPNSVPENVPQILINREPLRWPLNFDVELLGNCDTIIEYLNLKMGDCGEQVNQKFTQTKDIQQVEQNKTKFYQTTLENSQNCRYIFNGADEAFFKDSRENSEQDRDDDFKAKNLGQVDKSSPRTRSTKVLVPCVESENAGKSPLKRCIVEDDKSCKISKLE